MTAVFINALAGGSMPDIRKGLDDLHEEALQRAASPSEESTEHKEEKAIVALEKGQPC